MKSKLLSALLLFIPFTIFAQKNLTYKQKADEIKKSIWEKSDPTFEIKKVPEKYSNESAVVLSRSFEMQRTYSSRFKYMVITATAVLRTNKTSIFRERVKINDKTALEKFSTLAYDKIIDKTESLFFSSIKNKKEVFIGVKLIKSDGKEVVVNTDEEVVLAENDKDKTGKLAIPGLQVGDIIDYYISTTAITEGDQEAEDNKYFFLLADEYPVLNYSYSFQYGKKIIVTYNSANGAPAFNVATNADKDQIFTLEGKDMPKYNQEIWISPMRELPYFTISSVIESKFAQAMTGQKGYNTKVSRLENYIESLRNKFNPQYYPFDNTVQKRTEYHFKNTKTFKATPLDSTMRYFYNLWKFRAFCYKAPESYTANAMSELTANTKYCAATVSQMLYDMKVPHDILLVSSRFSNSIDNVFEEEDVDALIRINDTKPIYMVFNKVNTAFNELPTAYQGEKVIVLTPEKKGHPYFTFLRAEDILPVAPPSQNNLAEILNVSFVPENMQQLKVNRIVKQKSSMRMADQLALLQTSEIDEELRKLVAGDELKKRFSIYSPSKKNLALYEEAREKEKNAIKELFKTEISEQYDQDPKELLSYKILNPGLGDQNDTFDFETTFTIDNFVKKAGNNYILDIGKLIGGVVKIEDDKRTRNSNIYMPAARSLNYNMTINIPENYKAAGYNDLQTNKSNAAGSVSVATKLEGQKLTLNVTREYSKIFLKKEEWKDVLSLLDEAKLFSDKKILIEKGK